MSTTNCCMISRYIKIQFININHLSNIINYGCLPRRMRFIDENNIVLFTLFFLNKIFVFFLKNSFTFPTVIYNRGKVLESAQENSKISRCFVLWEP